ncbi:hypothetical protein NQZ68_019147 [Dissostichus eleginoides]|nr:hypothetical protein NQZ68_019147 [Dissostichus eleginoides]
MALLKDSQLTEKESNIIRTRAGSTVETALKTNWDQSAKPFQLLELSVRINSQPHTPLPSPLLHRRLNKGSHAPSSTALHNFLG